MADSSGFDLDIKNFILSKKHVDSQTKNALVMGHNADSVMLFCPENYWKVSFERTDVLKFKDKTVILGISYESGHTETKTSIIELFAGDKKNIVLSEGGSASGIAGFQSGTVSDVDITITLTGAILRVANPNKGKPGEGDETLVNVTPGAGGDVGPNAKTDDTFTFDLAPLFTGFVFIGGAIALAYAYKQGWL